MSNRPRELTGFVSFSKGDSVGKSPGSSWIRT
jgi:hypothetical protein